MLGFLKATYGDPNKELSAWSRLDAIKQGKKSFLSHFAEFRRLVADTDLNESAQISYLRRTLSDDLRRAMVGVPVPHTLNEYANLISTYDNDLRYLPTRNSHQRTYAAAATVTATRYPDAMEIDTSNYAPVGSAEREKRIRENRCFKCNSKNHFSRHCSVPMPIRSSSVPRSPAPAQSRTRRGSSVSSASSSKSRGRKHGRSPKNRQSKGPSRS